MKQFWVQIKTSKKLGVHFVFQGDTSFKINSTNTWTRNANKFLLL